VFFSLFFPHGSFDFNHKWNFCTGGELIMEMKALSPSKTFDGFMLSSSPTLENGTFYHLSFILINSLIATLEQLAR
jgi:hypothetical protein